MEDIADIYYRHAKGVFEIFNNKNIGNYYNLYVEIDTLLLADVFENFGNMCLRKYELDPAHCLSSPGFACQSCF